MKRGISLLGMALLSVLLLWARVPDYPDFRDAKGFYYRFYRDDMNGNLIEGHDGEVVFWGLFERDYPEELQKLKKLVVPATAKSVRDVGSDQPDPRTYRVTRIGEHAFQGMTELEEIVLPEGIKSVDPFSMSGIPAKRINIPSTLITFYPQNLHGYDGKWEAVTVAAKHPRLSAASGILYSKKKDTLWVMPQARQGSVIVPATVKVIAEEAFADAKKVTQVQLPAGLKKMGRKAFGGSTVTKVNIPGGVKDVPEKAFAFCQSLSQVTLANGPTSIGDEAFMYCTALKSIKLPATVKKIGKEAFYGCRNVRDFYCDAKVPPAADIDAFRDVKNCKLHVPAGSEEAYKKAPRWQEFFK